ncbi:MAG: hypothetical protein HYU69_12300 [Bacteroidetes bacterium]|nr:hypothetical protein [Bacteroidota bacterium]
MKLLTSPTSAYLLEAGLEVLHQQSNEWRSEIAFWRDETAFFYALVVRKTGKEVPVNSKKSLELIEAELIRITGGELDELQQEVDLHEYFLSHMLQIRKEDQMDYREKHKQMAAKFDSFEKRFKALKKEIFKVVESLKNTLVIPQ